MRSKQYFLELVFVALAVFVSSNELKAQRSYNVGKLDVTGEFKVLGGNGNVLNTYNNGVVRIGTSSSDTDSGFNLDVRGNARIEPNDNNPSDTGNLFVRKTIEATTLQATTLNVRNIMLNGELLGNDENGVFMAPSKLADFWYEYSGLGRLISSIKDENNDNVADDGVYKSVKIVSQPGVAFPHALTVLGHQQIVGSLTVTNTPGGPSEFDGITTPKIDAAEYRLNGQPINFGGPWIKGNTTQTDLHYSGNVGIGSLPSQALAYKFEVHGDQIVRGVLTVREGLDVNANVTAVASVIGAYQDDEPLLPGLNAFFSNSALLAQDKLAITHNNYGGLKLNASSNVQRGGLKFMIDDVKKAEFVNTGDFNVYSNLYLGNNGSRGIDNAKLSVDGRVYISEDDVAYPLETEEKGFTDTTLQNYKDYLLWVEEGIVAWDIAVVDTVDWPDYVFAKDYNLPSLSEVEKNIKETGHLHTMPSAKEVDKNGFRVSDITKRTLRTVEELMLHTIEQQKQIETQNDLIKKLTERIEALESKK